MKFVLLPGTMGSGEVFCQDGLGPCWANWTYIEAPGEGGALKRATSGLAVALTTGLSPTTRDCAVYVVVADCFFLARRSGLDDHPDVVGPLLHGVPGEAVAGAEVTDHVERTARLRDAELVDGRLSRGRWTSPSR